MLQFPSILCMCKYGLSEIVEAREFNADLRTGRITSRTSECDYWNVVVERESPSVVTLALRSSGQSFLSLSITDLSKKPQNLIIVYR